MPIHPQNPMKSRSRFRRNQPGGSICAHSRKAHNTTQKTSFIILILLLFIPTAALAQNSGSNIEVTAASFHKRMFEQYQVFDEICSVIYYDSFSDAKSSEMLESIIDRTKSSISVLKLMSEATHRTTANAKTDSLKIVQWTSMRIAAENLLRGFEQIESAAQAKIAVLSSENRVERDFFQATFNQAKVTSDMYLQISLLNMKQSQLWTKESVRSFQEAMESEARP